MNLHAAIFSLCDKHRLSPTDGHRLKELAKLDTMPPSLLRHLSSGMAVLAAIMAGLGIVFWIAANWQFLPRLLRFTVLEVIVLCTLLGAWRLPAARLPLALLGFLACGGLLACIGQTYQTGADPWQLFALWAALTFPLCLGARHDVLWVPWLIIALTGIALFSELQTGSGWWKSEVSLYSSLSSWLPAIALAALLHCAPRSLTGAGLWSLRLSMMYAVISLTTLALQSLFASAKVYFVLLLIVAALACGFSFRKLFDLVIFSALCLSFNVLVLGGLAYALFNAGHSADWIVSLVMIAGAAACLFALTVKAVMYLVRIYLRENIS